MSFVEPILEIMAAAREARQVELLDLTGKRAPLIDAPPRSPSQDIEDRDFEQEPETYRDKDAVFERGVDRQTMHLCPVARARKKALRLEDEVKTMKEAPPLQISDPSDGQPLVGPSMASPTKSRDAVASALWRALELDVFERAQELARDDGTAILESVCIARRTPSRKRGTTPTTLVERMMP